MLYDFAGVEVKDAEKNDDDYDEFDSQMQSTRILFLVPVSYFLFGISLTVAVRLQHVTSGLGRSNASPSEPTKRKPVKFDCDIETPAQDQEIQVKYDEKMKPYHATNVKLCAGSEVKSKTKGVRDMTYVETGESVTSKPCFRPSLYFSDVNFSVSVSLYIVVTFRCDTEDNIKMRALNWKAQQKAKIRKDQAQLPPQPQPEHDDSLSALKDYASDVEDATDIHKAPREILDLTIEDDENKAQLKEKCSECDEEMKNSSATNWCSECENICIALKRNKRSANVGIWSNKKHKFLRNGPESKLSHDLIIVIDSRVTEMNFRVQFLSFSFVSIRFR